MIQGVRPATPNQLHHWLRVMLDVDVPRAALCEGATCPFDYLCHAFFEPCPDDPTSRDCVVWACRGGGKTFYAAVATVLDLLFKPGIEVKVLAGSLEQAQRMHAYLRRFFERPPLTDLLDGRFGQRRAQLLSGSSVEVLAQSHTSVRGARPQKLRCDEVELFDPDVWEAAQLVTRSRWCAGDGQQPTFVHGAIEALSTMHLADGLMSRITSEVGDGDPGDSPRRLFKWGVIDVLESCPPRRACDSCELFDACRGRAKRAAGPAGHLLIDDALRMRRRVDQATWETEMLCLRPSRSDAVLPEFDPDIHVADFDLAAACEDTSGGHGTWVVGMDFGFRAPTVILWACLDNQNVLRVIDESARTRTLLGEHIRIIKDGGRAGCWPVPAWLGVDPAGHQRSDQTGLSPITQLRRSGLTVRAPRVPMARGLQAIRARLAPATGSPTLFIHSRCTTLIDSLRRYHYPANRPADPLPVKDGSDHAVDALRYLIAAMDLRSQLRIGSYV